MAKLYYDDPKLAETMGYLASLPVKGLSTSLENTKTPFAIQVVIATANVVIGVGLVIYLDSNPLVAAAMMASYTDGVMSVVILMKS